MTDLSVDEQKKVMRTLFRLKHSINADREIKAGLERMAALGTEGVHPRLEGTLAELLGNSDAQ